ncbi:hypothetical protein LNAOJCKE_5063 [Methylorubrum aminovorans]|uniref:PNPLA domain-containing protein n=1 Tax=Methylorubrum aminovorans TaxID=269069 RepID=A0ABQ4UP15_9HYPH|nr:patatin-like phospholipase family protein [Methylorubrum aminovorans]GJE67830.1 hypothetical protein LNAOJCKE_5063 [Methylorubrum aminovorans]
MQKDLGIIGLALSGGGSRAIAFHLGCLRALHQLGLLERVAVISTISGGSVIGAAYKAHQGSFEEFDATIQQLLRRGLSKAMARQLFGLLGLRIIGAWLITSTLALVLAAIRMVVTVVSWLVPIEIKVLNRLREIRSPVLRFASRTSLLEQALNTLIFRGVRLQELSAAGPDLVVNATELRTGSAFRFARRESGSWRLGRLVNNDVTLAHAVAASAAYPLFLPAFDEVHTFEKQGATSSQRINLTDGGVYDNLGLSNFWPGRSADVSLNVTKIDTIICCSAGYGLRQDPPSQFLLARMVSAINVTFDRAQNASIARLYELKEAGKIANFILPYLGQRDGQLVDPPADLVPREAAHIYPTNFNAMPQDWIDRLSRRGEQLTLLLAAQNLGYVRPQA